VGSLATILRRIVVFLLVDNWRITLVMVAGAAAVYLLLPRPRAQKTVFGAGLGLLAVLVAGALLVGMRAVNAEAFLFYAFSATAVIAGGLLVTQRNPARAALSFALVVLSTCGLFLLLAAPFLAAATAIVYAGAIVVTFLFVLMLAQQEGPSDADYRSREPLLSAIAGFILLGVLLYVLQANFDLRPLDKLLSATDSLIGQMERATATNEKNQLLERAVALTKEYEKLAETQPDLPASRYLRDAVGRADGIYTEGDVARMRDLLASMHARARELERSVGTLRPSEERSTLSELSGPASSRQSSELRRDRTARPAMPAENTAHLGRSLFSDYLLAVELGGTLLLVATIGAIAIADRGPAASPRRRLP